MIIEYDPQGVCSRHFSIDVQNGIIQDITIDGGCHGNLQGIAALIRGQKVEDVIQKLENIQCRSKGTSCPDQIAKALKQAL
ncbi:MAG: TIGR03905 family TSCPD domain-containing protein [Bradymonadia bacterium]